MGDTLFDFDELEASLPSGGGLDDRGPCPWARAQLRTAVLDCTEAPEKAAPPGVRRLRPGQDLQGELAPDCPQALGVSVDGLPRGELLFDVRLTTSPPQQGMGFFLCVTKSGAKRKHPKLPVGQRIHGSGCRWLAVLHQATPLDVCQLGGYHSAGALL